VPHIVSITSKIQNVTDNRHAALEAYKELMRAMMDDKKITFEVTDGAGVTENITIDVNDLDDYAGFFPPTGFMA